MCSLGNKSKPLVWQFSPQRKLRRLELLVQFYFTYRTTTSSRENIHHQYDTLLRSIDKEDLSNFSRSSPSHFWIKKESPRRWYRFHSCLESFEFIRRKYNAVWAGNIDEGCYCGNIIWNGFNGYFHADTLQWCPCLLSKFTPIILLMLYFSNIGDKRSRFKGRFRSQRLLFIRCLHWRCECSRWMSYLHHALDWSIRLDLERSLGIWMGTLEFLGLLAFWKNRVSLGTGQQIDTDTDGNHESWKK